MHHFVRLARLMVTALGVGAVLVAFAPELGGLRTGLADADRWVRRDGLDLVLAQLVGAVAWLAALWLAVGFALVAGARLPGAAGRISRTLASGALPAGLRRTAAVALGVSLATSSVPALASLSGAAPTPSTCFTSRRVPLPAAGPSAGGRVVVTADAAIAGLIHAGGPVGGRAGAGRPPTDGTKGVSVDWPLGDAVRRPDDVGRSPVGWPLEPGEVTVSVVEWPLLAGADPSGPRADATVVTAPADRVLVAPGDTLWSIAGRRLGPGAAAPAIAAEWRRWHAANRELIGPDPRRLRPGVVLRVPGTP